MPLVVAMTARRFRLDLVPGARIEPQPGISLRAKYGMPMTLEHPPSQAPAEEPATAEAASRSDA
jgi:hypothetical protein